MLFALSLAVSLPDQTPFETVEPRIQSAMIAATPERLTVPRSTDRPMLSGTQGISLESFRRNLLSQPKFAILRLGFLVSY